MKKAVVIVLLGVVFIAFIALNDNVLTGNYVKYREEDLERKSDKTEIYFYQNPVQRAKTLNIKLVPGISGIEKRVELYRVMDNEEKLLRSFNFCTWQLCRRGRIYDIFISKAYPPGTYALLVHDKAFGDIKGYFQVA